MRSINFFRLLLGYILCAARLHWTIVQNYMSIRFGDCTNMRFWLWCNLFHRFISKSSIQFPFVCIYVYVLLSDEHILVNNFSIYTFLSYVFVHRDFVTQKNNCEPKQSENGFQLFEIRYVGTLSHILFHVVLRFLLSSFLYFRIVKVSNADTALFSKYNISNVLQSDFIIVPLSFCFLLSLSISFSYGWDCVV